MKTYIDSNGDEFDYEVIDTELHIKQYRGKQHQVRMPETINGALVTHIDSLAFMDCDSVFKLDLPKTIKNVACDAFVNCGYINIWYRGRHYYTGDIDRLRRDIIVMWEGAQ